MQQQKLSEVNVGALERRTRYGPQRAPVQQFHPFEQSPSGARRKDATIGCMRKSIGFPCLKCVEWRHVETKEKLGASCAEPGCAWPIFFSIHKNWLWNQECQLYFSRSCSAIGWSKMQLNRNSDFGKAVNNMWKTVLLFFINLVFLFDG